MKALFVMLLLTAGSAYAQKEEVSETAVVVKKGSPAALLSPGTEYQIVDGKDELAGEPEMEKTRAMASWRTACRDWKQTLKELNKENHVLMIHCGAPKAEKDADHWIYRGDATYKLKVKVREKAG